MRVFFAWAENNPPDSGRQHLPDEWAQICEEFKAAFDDVEISELWISDTCACARVQIFREEAPAIQTALAALRQARGIARMVWAETEATIFL